MKPMRLIYIYHSGFIIESKEFAILIDYYRDTPEFYVHRHFLKRPGRLYILSSHAHPDHFNPEILSWKPERPDIRTSGISCPKISATAKRRVFTMPFS